MTYITEIIKTSIVDKNGEVLASLEWLDDSCITISTSGIITNSKDWPDVSRAIFGALKTMERSTRPEYSTPPQSDPFEEVGKQRGWAHKAIEGAK